MNDDNSTEKQNSEEPAKNNNPDEAMNEPNDIPKSNDQKIDEDFPGYPHQPAEEDLLNPNNNNGQIAIDVENLTRANKVPHQNLAAGSEVTPSSAETIYPIEDDEADDLGIVAGTEADVTEEDLMLLGEIDSDMDLSEDEEMLTPESKALSSAATGEDLDVPGAELDDEDEIIGDEDEENNYYSIGGDNHDNLEEGNANNN